MTLTSPIITFTTLERVRNTPLSPHYTCLDFTAPAYTSQTAFVPFYCSVWSSVPKLPHPYRRIKPLHRSGHNIHLGSHYTYHTSTSPKQLPCLSSVVIKLPHLNRLIINTHQSGHDIPLGPHYTFHTFTASFCTTQTLLLPSPGCLRARQGYTGGQHLPGYPPKQVSHDN